MALGPDHKVKQAFTNRTILLTGVTGFVGKVYLEKVLRCCPDLNELRVLVRGNRRYPDAQERFQAEVLASSLFDRLKQESPEVFSKIKVVAGHLTKPRLGLDPEDFQSLGRTLDLIVNCAASVNFREELDRAIDVNTRSLFSLVELAKGHDIPFLQVSTCYVHGYHSGLIEERLYPSWSGQVPLDDSGHFNIPALIQSLEADIESMLADQDDPEARSQALIDLGIRTANRLGWNDTYTLTKWMAEAYLHRELQGRTLTIVRPAIVEGCLSDPEPGWVEGVKVADAVILAYARRKARFLPGNPDSALDIIPVDLVVNGMVLASAEALSKEPGTRTYQIASSSINPITLHEFREWVDRYCREHWRELDRLFLAAPGRPVRLLSRRLFQLSLRASGWLLRARVRLWGGTGSEHALKSFETTAGLANLFGFYMASTYMFDTLEMERLANRLGAFGGEFDIDVRRIHWPDYVAKHLQGLNRFALRPEPRADERTSGEQKARKVA